MKKTAFVSIACSFVLICIHNLTFAQLQSVSAESIHISWQPLQNNYASATQCLAMITIHNNSDAALPAASWKIYFSLRYHGYDLRSLNDQFVIHHVNGELFYLEPTEKFTGLNKHDTVNIQFAGTGRIANISDAPSGFFWVDEKQPGKAININNVSINTPASDDSITETVATAAFETNKSITDIPMKDLPILPTPVSMQYTNGDFVLDKNVVIVTDAAFKNEAGYFVEHIKKIIGIAPAIVDHAISKRIILETKQLPAEAYELSVQPDSIVIKAASDAGIFYGIQSVQSLLPADTWAVPHTAISVPCVDVKDAPRFALRSFMLDVSRNFQPKEEILKLLDVMSLYKLNVFHFHFSDDEGWRLEIPGLPELTQVGARRGYPFDQYQQLQPSYGSAADNNNTSGSGYYSRQDFISILQYATQRHILVIPEIESPGHAHAAIVAMKARYQTYMRQGKQKEAEQYILSDMHDSSRYISAQGFDDNVMNVALPSTYTFMEKVIDELQAMYRAANAPLKIVHVGGDEVPGGAWKGSPAVQAYLATHKDIHSLEDLQKYFFHTIQHVLDKHGIKMNSWEDIVVAQDADQKRNVLTDTSLINHHALIDAWWSTFGEGSEDIPYRLANAGYSTTLSNFDYYYFDLAYSKLFAEPGDGWIGYLDVDKTYSFNPLDYFKNAKEDIAGNALPRGYFAAKERLTTAGRKNITGLQGALWCENVKSSTTMEYLLLPRLLALAERAWSAEPAWAAEEDSARSMALYQQDWNVFANTLGKRELPKLAYYHGGFTYRIPSPGVVRRDGKVFANMSLPGFEIRYTVNGSEPMTNSSLFKNMIDDKSYIRLKAFDKKGNGSNTISLRNY